LLGACESDDLLGQVPDAAPTGDAAPADATPRCEQGLVPRRLTVRSDVLEDGPTAPPIEGVRVCVLDAPELGCGVTGADGVWDTCLPPDADVAFTLEKDGYVPTILPIRTSAGVIEKARNTELILIEADSAAWYWQQLGVEFLPTTQGLVLVTVHEYDPNEDWQSVCLVGASALSDPAPAVGPGYLNLIGDYEPDRAWTDLGHCHVFFAFDGSVDADIRVSHPELSRCHQLDEGWSDGGRPQTITVPARAGFRTHVHTTCQ